MPYPGLFPAGSLPIPHYAREDGFSLGRQRQRQRLHAQAIWPLSDAGYIDNYLSGVPRHPKN